MYIFNSYVLDKILFDSIKTYNIYYYVYKYHVFSNPLEHENEKNYKESLKEAAELKNSNALSTLNANRGFSVSGSLPANL